MQLIEILDLGMRILLKSLGKSDDFTGHTGLMVNRGLRLFQQGHQLLHDLVVDTSTTRKQQVVHVLL